jgi:hypothetical protein
MVASTFTQALFDKICDLIADGKSVREICEMKGMPCRRTFHGWCRRTPELMAQYDAAYLVGEQSILDDIQYIADTETDAPKARNRIDARKWTLKVRNRKVYGDHVTEEVTGPNGGPLQVVRLRMAPVEELPESTDIRRDGE